MKNKIFVFISIILLFFILLFLYNDNKNKYYIKIVNNINDIYNKKEKINDKNNYISSLYDFFIENNLLKEELLSYKYENFLINNKLIEIYNENNNILDKIDNNIKSLNNTKNIINNSFTMKNFKKILSDGKEIIVKNFNSNSFDLNKKEVDNFFNIELNKYNKLKSFINNINTNKNKWNKNNDTIIVEDDEYKKYLEDNNNEFGITITVKKKIIVINKPIPIFMYHAVNDETWGITSLFQKVKDFEKEMKYLNDNGYKTIFLSDIKNNLDEKKVIILTFDDAYEDFYRIAYPIMKKYNIKSNLFVISNTDGGKYITKEQVKELSNSGFVEIGSHTVSHPNLTVLDNNELTKELKESKSSLEKLLDKKVVTFAYPMGYNNEKVINEVSKYYDYALLMGGGIHYVSNNTNYLKLKRVSMYRGASFEYFTSKVKTSN